MTTDKYHVLAALREAVRAEQARAHALNDLRAALIRHGATPGIGMASGVDTLSGLMDYRDIEESHLNGFLTNL